jgi:hypothetical protein
VRRRASPFVRLVTGLILLIVGALGGSHIGLVLGRFVSMLIGHGRAVPSQSRAGYQRNQIPGRATG